MSEKVRNNNNSDNPLTSRRNDGGKNVEKICEKIKIYFSHLVALEMCVYDECVWLLIGY